jgi:hypothetical protein
MLSIKYYYYYWGKGKERGENVKDYEKQIMMDQI